MKLHCRKHGKLFHLQTHSMGVEAGEYAFYAGFKAVFREDCDNCKDLSCPYGFNLYNIRKNKKRRKKLLNYVFNPIIDEFADKYQIGISMEIMCRNLYEPIKSSVCVNKKDGKKLIELEEKVDRALARTEKAIEKLYEEYYDAKHLPQRTLGKTKKKRRKSNEDEDVVG